MERSQCLEGEGKTENVGAQFRHKHFLELSFFELPSSADYFTLYFLQLHARTVHSLGKSLHIWQI